MNAVKIMTPKGTAMSLLGPRATSNSPLRGPADVPSGDFGDPAAAAAGIGDNVGAGSPDCSEQHVSAPRRLLPDHVRKFDTLGADKALRTDIDQNSAS
ncbi:hypothetical protein [Streptomyces sp. NPDC047042]|uniref:hypothetical protein n=2 Tax=unclassified Streptomyces TaxID=2593676 RepID=UPI0033EDEB7B